MRCLRQRSGHPAEGGRHTLAKQRKGSEFYFNAMIYSRTPLIIYYDYVPRAPDMINQSSSADLEGEASAGLVGISADCHKK